MDFREEDPVAVLRKLLLIEEPMVRIVFNYEMFDHSSCDYGGWSRVALSYNA